MRPPHPLALRLIERLRDGAIPHARVIDFAAGSGRNGSALRRAGFDVFVIDDETAYGDAWSVPDAGFDAVISTHGLLHGTVASIASRLDVLYQKLKAGGMLFATFGSTLDARFGMGKRIAPSTYCAVGGDERGIPHTFFTQAELRELLVGRYDVDSLEEQAAEKVAGTWAHERAPLEAAVHWFLEARRRY
jgi:hypothetical protein